MACPFFDQRSLNTGDLEQSNFVFQVGNLINGLISVSSEAKEMAGIGRKPTERQPRLSAGLCTTFHFKHVSDCGTARTEKEGSEQTQSYLAGSRGNDRD